jgi:hypothetical protein
LLPIRQIRDPRFERRQLRVDRAPLVEGGRKPPDRRDQSRQSPVRLDRDDGRHGAWSSNATSTFVLRLQSWHSPWITSRARSMRMSAVQSGTPSGP